MVGTFSDFTSRLVSTFSELPSRLVGTFSDLTSRFLGTFSDFGEIRAIFTGGIRNVSSDVGDARGSVSSSLSLFGDGFPLSGGVEALVSRMSNFRIRIVRVIESVFEAASFWRSASRFAISSSLSGESPAFSTGGGSLEIIHYRKR